MPAPESSRYDTLIVAGGSQYSYFGHDDWQALAPELEVARGRARRSARRILDGVRGGRARARRRARAAWLTFVVVGAGPTGVEMAGQIAEIARDTRRRLPLGRHERRRAILLVEAGERVLTGVPAVALCAARAVARAARRDAAARPRGHRRRAPIA